MSHFRLDDDFFSPVRFDMSTVDGSSLGSEGSLNDFLNADEFSLINVGENKVTLEKSVLISDQKNEMKSKDGNITNIFSPVQFDMSNVDRSSLGSEESINDFLNAGESSLTLVGENKMLNDPISPELEKVKEHREYIEYNQAVRNLEKLYVAWNYIKTGGITQASEDQKKKVIEDCKKLKTSIVKMKQKIEDADKRISEIENQLGVISLEESALGSDQKNQMKSKESGSINISTPLSKNSSDKSIAKRALKLKLEQNYKTISLKKGSVESHQKESESLCKEKILDSHICVASDDLNQEYRSASFPLKNKNSTLKHVTKKQKSSTQSPRCDSVNKVQKLRTVKQSVEKKFTENSSSLPEHTNDIKSGDSSVMSTESKENISENRNSNYLSCQKENPTLNQVHLSYEESVKKIICNSFSSESAKLRQNVYMHQMAFYREMNKIKDTMKNQHFVTTERLFKVIEELMQINASLKLALASKN